MPDTISILILEDNDTALAVIRNVLHEISGERGVVFEKFQFSTYMEAWEFLEHNPEKRFDLILLDRNDAAGESFHQLPLEDLGAEKIISISSVPWHNEAVRNRGVQRTVHKDYADPDAFAEGLKREIGKSGQGI